MTIPWRDDDQFDTAATAGEGQITILDGFCFAISAQSGDIVPGKAMGVFVSDARYLSRCELRINGKAPDVIDASTPSPFTAIHRGIAHVADEEDTVTMIGVERRRHVGNGMREDIILRSGAVRPIEFEMSMLLGTDFADPFLVRQSRAPGANPDVLIETTSDALTFRADFDGRRSTRVTCSRAARFTSDGLCFSVRLEPGAEWLASIQLTPVAGDQELAPDHEMAMPVEHSAPAQRLARWHQETTVLSAQHDSLVELLARSSSDLAALRIPDPDDPGRFLVAAGAPWYMTLFGRDSLLTAFAALPVAPELAQGVLHALGRLQGKIHDAATEEQPGRILHEVRRRTSDASLTSAYRYYGQIDANPLYVIVLGEARRFGLSLDEVAELLPYADRALDWCERYGDRDGDGYLEYLRSGDAGLLNQGWKDSSAAMAFRDGRIAAGPIALAEVQAYLYGAYRVRADLADEFADPATAEACRAKAAALKERFNRDFWMDDVRWYAMALDGDKQPIDALSSNIGHCLWSGIVDEDKAARVAEVLMSDDMFSGWGIRTMAASSGAYDPLSYHNGAVWPHDNAIVAAGLMRYGFVDAAQTVITAITDVGGEMGGRLPEIFGGATRVEGERPVEYPTTCSPQAWAAATPWWMLRTLLRLDVSAQKRVIWCAPAIPRVFGDLRLAKVAIGGTRLTIDVVDGKVCIDGLPDGYRLVTNTRVAAETFAA